MTVLSASQASVSGCSCHPLIGLNLANCSCNILGQQLPDTLLVSKLIIQDWSEDKRHRVLLELLESDQLNEAQKKDLPFVASLLNAETPLKVKIVTMLNTSRAEAMIKAWPFFPTDSFAAVFAKISVGASLEALTMLSL